MSVFQAGDRVTATEGLSLPDGRIVPRPVAGVVQEVLDAGEVYPHPPQYHPAHRGERKATKFPADTAVCRVLVDDEFVLDPKTGQSRAGADGRPVRRGPRNFHESQLAPE